MTFPRNESSVVYKTEGEQYLTVVREMPGSSVMVDVHTRQDDGSWGAPNPSDGGSRTMVKPSMVTDDYRMGRA